MLLLETLKNLIFLIVTRVSARDYTVGYKKVMLEKKGY